MNNTQKRVENILRNWRGQDAGEHASAAEIAERIDHEYQEYLASLPPTTSAIRAGHQASESRLAS